MKRLAIFEYDDKAMHDGDGDPEAREWFETVVLPAGHVVLDGSNEIGDEIGTMRVASPTVAHYIDVLTSVWSDKVSEYHEPALHAMCQRIRAELQLDGDKP